MAADTFLPPVLMVARLQKCSDRFLLVEDVGGRHFIVDKTDPGPIRFVIYAPELTPQRSQ